MKNVNEIIENVKKGNRVFWKNPGYEVKIYSNGAFICCTMNDYMIGLTQRDGTLNGKIEDFYAEEI